MATRILVNIGLVEEAERAASLDVDGVGLLRAELLLTDALGGEHPRRLLDEGRGAEFVATLAEALERIAAAFDPRPVVYRTTDFRSNEFAALRGGAELEPQESNPMIGWRGCARYLAQPDLFAFGARSPRNGVRPPPQPRPHAALRAHGLGTGACARP